MKSAFCAIRLQNNNNNNNNKIATADYYPAAQIKDLLLRFIIPQSGKNFACLPKDDVNDDNATHVLPLPGDVYEEGPLIHTGCSFRFTHSN